MCPIQNPSLEEFLKHARHAFGFLTTDFGFQEETLHRGADANAYQVRYVNATTRVTVEGVNWGYGVNVLLGPKRQPLFRRADTFPLWAIVKLRRPDLYGALAIGDQLAQLRAQAIALRECANDVLSGDFKVSAEVERLLGQQAAPQRSELGDWLFTRAVQEADEAFRSKDYERVQRLLAPHEKRLTPAQRKKLEYARRNRD